MLFYVFAFFDTCTLSVNSIENARLQVWTIVKPNDLSVSLMEVFLASVLAPIVACISAILVNYKIINKIATKLHISQKYGDENLYSYFLNSKEVDWVYVRDSKNGFTYQGRVVSFSETATFQELIMSEVTVFEYEQSIELYSIPVIYLNRPMGEFVIEVISSDLLEKVNGKKTA